jgi:hypothetical protein
VPSSKEVFLQERIRCQGKRGRWNWGRNAGTIMQTSRPGLLALFHHYVHAWAHETSHALCITLSQRHPLHTTQSGQATLFITLSTYTHTTVQHQAESSCCCFSGREREREQSHHRSAAARLHGHGQSPVSLFATFILPAHRTRYC